MARRPGRTRSQLPTCYYEGFLDKRSFKDKTSRKLWACLCGNTLFFFNEKRDTDYIEKLDLSNFISITDDCSQGHDRNLDTARLNLQMKDENIKFSAPNGEARELWKGYIHSVAKLAVPPSLNLLPGQIYMLKEAIEKEKERNQPVLPPAVPDACNYISLQGDMPACYHVVSRLEAELLLEREAGLGNLLLRPGREKHTFAVTTRQDLNGSVFRHYRVTRKYDGSFAIDVDNPVPCATLNDVIDYLVDKTDGVLVPLIIQETYEKRISFIWSDMENGEKSVQAPSNPVPPIAMLNPEAPRVPVRRNPPCVPMPASFDEDNVYLNDSMPEEEESEDSPAVPPPPPETLKPERKAPKKAMMPPVSRKSSSASTTPPYSAFSSSSYTSPPSSSQPSSTSSSSQPSSTSLSLATASSPPSSTSSLSSSSSSPSLSSLSSSAAASSQPSSTSSTNSVINRQETMGQISLAEITEMRLKLKAKCQD